MLLLSDAISNQENEQLRALALVTGLALEYNSQKRVSARAGEGDRR